MLSIKFERSTFGTTHFGCWNKQCQYTNIYIFIWYYILIAFNKCNTLTHYICCVVVVSFQFNSDFLNSTERKKVKQAFFRCIVMHTQLMCNLLPLSLLLSICSFYIQFRQYGCGAKASANANAHTSAIHNTFKHL